MVSITAVLIASLLVVVNSNPILHTFIADISQSRTRLVKNNRSRQGSLCRINAVTDATRGENIEKKKVLIGKKQGPKRSIDIPQKMIHLLEKMIKSKKFPGSIEFEFDETQIDEKIKQYKINLSICTKETGVLLLRVAIAYGRRDVCRVLLKHGALPLAVDSEGKFLLSPP
jgi:hypothetical protein